MHCASCGNNIERSLSGVKGVKNVTVSMMMKKGTIEAEDSVSEEELKKAVSKLGYNVTAVEKSGS